MDSGQVRSPRPRAGSTRSAVRKAIRAARHDGRLEAYDEPVAALAEVVAAQLDTAAAGDRAGEVVRLVKSLRDLLDDLPLRAERVPDESAPVDPAAGADPVDRELEQLVGAGPSVGDSPHT